MIVLAWYLIVGTSVGGGLIAFYLYLKYAKKQCEKKLLVTGIALIGITIFIILAFLIFGFAGLGFAKN